VQLKKLLRIRALDTSPGRSLVYSFNSPVLRIIILFLPVLRVIILFSPVLGSIHQSLVHLFQFTSPVIGLLFSTVLSFVYCFTSPVLGLLFSPVLRVIIMFI
jgi:hypothetical protein